MRPLARIVIVALISAAVLAFADPAAFAGERFDPLTKAEQAAKAKVPDPLAAREEAQRRKLAGPPPRVVVFRGEHGLDADSGPLHTTIERIIGRAGARFVDEVDLAQQGRVRRAAVGREDRPFPASAQTGRVPDEQIAYVASEVADARRRLRDLGRRDRSGVAADLLRLVDENSVWFNDRAETRRVLFDLYVTLGEAAIGLPEQTAAYYRPIERRSDNYFLYLAAAMIWEERQVGASVLAERVPAPAQREVDRILAMIERGEHPPIALSLYSVRIDPIALEKTWRIVVNGLERVPELRHGEPMIDVPRGRIDISLERRDGGYGLSHRVDLVLMRGEEPQILELARQEAGKIRRELEQHVDECERELLPDAIATIATFSALHPGEDVYLATAGASLRDVDVWRWNPDSFELHKVIDVDRGFPLRFALLAGAGMSFGGGSVDSPVVAPEEGSTNLRYPTSAADLLRFDATAAPIDLQLRAHWHRLLLGFGVQLAANVGGRGTWSDRYDVPVDERVVDRDDVGTAPAETLHDARWNRLIYGTVGVVLLEHAPLGIGPRAYVRFGGSDLPHAIDLTGHVGATYDPSFGRKPPSGRLAALIDLDVYGGIRVPYGTSIYRIDDGDGATHPFVMPNLGFSVGAGWSF